jgi:hypothetical protein
MSNESRTRDGALCTSTTLIRRLQGSWRATPQLLTRLKGRLGFIPGKPLFWSDTYFVQRIYIDHVDRYTPLQCV